MSDENSESGRKKIVVAGPSGSGTVPVRTEPEMNKPIGRVYTDAVLNFLLRLACQVSQHQKTLRYLDLLNTLN